VALFVMDDLFHHDDQIQACASVGKPPNAWGLMICPKPEGLLRPR
jgi:hypothetical protein